MATMTATTDLLELWHEFRLPVLAVLGIAILLFKLLGHQTKPAQLPSAAAEKFVDLPIQSDGTVLLPESQKLKQPAPKSKNDPAGAVLSSKQKKPAKQAPKRITGEVRRSKKPSQVPAATTPTGDNDASEPCLQIYVFYSSLTGSTEKYAKKFAEDLFAGPEYTPSPAPPAEAVDTPPPSPGEKPAKILPPIVHNVDYLDLDDYFISHPHSSPESRTKSVYLMLLPTYEIESPVDAFLQHLEETHHDFRIDSRPLRNIAGFSVFGFGDKEGWPDDTRRGSGMFCGQARDCDRWMGKLTGNKRLFPIGMGDVKGDAQASLDEWRVHLEVAVKELAQGDLSGGEGTNADKAVDSEDEEDVAQDEPVGEKLVDVEDIGDSMRKNDNGEDVVVLVGGGKRKGAPIPVDFTTSKATNLVNKKEMVAKDSPTYNALTKQGYTIVGSHSGVKLCRWTKSALRGRGSCYKFSFYGIKSHLCMETTPSLSCSNKCVFCWRHGTNPVSTTWRWVVDPPADILRGVMEGHYKKIKMMKGIPGVRAERFAEAFTIRHCALSLVGEPIFYPHINELLAMLHERHISSFLVCNAQHPEQLASLRYVTQLYVSIDASNKESLRRIDRPLHRDFWERFQRCLEILRAKRNRMRTVFRLTLVKGFNVDEEVEGYADLVSKGLPGFVEVKGVTYCGTSTSVGAGLTMQNVPFYEEVADFVVKLNAALAARGLEYGIAAEHAHSCCVLIASEDYYIDGKWHTIIDYKRFFELLESGKEFGPLDYVGPPTPEWANWGNGGFDPADERHYRKGKGKTAPDTGTSCQAAADEMEAESGCG